MTANSKIKILVVLFFSSSLAFGQVPASHNEQPGPPFLKKDKIHNNYQHNKHIKPGNPELIEMKHKMGQTLATAEAHRGLAEIYERQGKIDEAAAELYKIIELFNSKSQDFDEEKTQMRSRVIRNIIPIYEHITVLYLKNDKDKDAEALLEKGISEYQKDYPTETVRLMLKLTEIYKKNNRLEKAEELYKKIISLNK
jgi:tetratricopeptide (TPR) repeat protein